MSESDEYDFEEFHDDFEDEVDAVVDSGEPTGEPHRNIADTNRKSNSVEKNLKHFGNDLDDDSDVMVSCTFDQKSDVPSPAKQEQGYEKQQLPDVTRPESAASIPHDQLDEDVQQEWTYSNIPDPHEAAPTETEKTVERFTDPVFDRSKLASLKQKSLSKRKQALSDENSIQDFAVEEHAVPVVESTISPKKKQIGLINSKLQEHNRQISVATEVSGSGASSGETTSNVKHSIQSEFAQLGLDAISPVKVPRRKGGGVGMGSTPAVTVASTTTSAPAVVPGGAGGSGVRNAYGRVVPQKKARDTTQVAPQAPHFAEQQTAGKAEVELTDGPETHQLEVSPGEKRKASFSAVGKWGRDIHPDSFAAPGETLQPGRQQRVTLKPALPARKIPPSKQASDPADASTAAPAPSIAAPAAVPAGRHTGRSYVPSTTAQSSVTVVKPTPPVAPKPSVPRAVQRAQPHIPGGKKVVPAVAEEIISDLMPASVLEENSTYLSLLESPEHEARGRESEAEGSVSTVKLDAAEGQHASPNNHSSSKKTHLHARFAVEDDNYSDDDNFATGAVQPPLSAPMRHVHHSPEQYPQSSRSQPDHPAAIKKRPLRAHKPAQRTNPHNPYYSGPLPPKTKRQQKQSAGGSGGKPKRLHKGRDWMADPTHRYDAATGLFSSFETDAKRESRKEQARVNAMLRRAVVEREAELARIAYLQRMHEIEVVERHHEECLLVSGMNQAERAEAVVLEQRLAELRRAAQEREDAMKAQLMNEIAVHARKEQQPLYGYMAPPSTSPPRHYNPNSPARRRLYQSQGAGSQDSPDGADISPISTNKHQSDEDQSPASVSGNPKQRRKRRPGSGSTVNSVTSQASKADRSVGAYPRKGRQIVEHAAAAPAAHAAPPSKVFGSGAVHTSKTAAPHPPAAAPPAKKAHQADSFQIHGTKGSSRGLSAENSVMSLGQDHSTTLDGSSTSSDPSRVKRRGSLQQMAGLSAAASRMKVDLFGDEVDVTSIQQDIERNLEEVDEEVEVVQVGEDSAYYMSAVQSMVGIDAEDAKNIEIHDFYSDSPRAVALAAKAGGISLEEAFEHAGELDLPLEGSEELPMDDNAGEDGNYSDDGWEDEEPTSQLAKKQVGTPVRRNKGVEVVQQWEDEEVLDQSEEAPSTSWRAQDASPLDEPVEDFPPEPTTSAVLVKPNTEVRVVHATFADPAPVSRESKSRGTGPRKSTPCARRMQLVSPPVSSEQLEDIFSQNNGRRKSTPKVRKTPNANTRRGEANKSANHSGASSRQRSRGASFAASTAAPADTGAEEGDYGAEEFEDYENDDFEPDSTATYSSASNVAEEVRTGKNTIAATVAPLQPQVLVMDDPYEEREAGSWPNSPVAALAGAFNVTVDPGSQQGSPLLGLRLGGSVDFSDSLAYSTASNTLSYSPEKGLPEQTGFHPENTGDFNYYISQPNSLYEHEDAAILPNKTQGTLNLSQEVRRGMWEEADEPALETGDNYSDDAFDAETLEEAAPQREVPAARDSRQWQTAPPPEVPVTPDYDTVEDAPFSPEVGYSPSLGIAGAKQYSPYEPSPRATVAKAPQDEFSDSFDGGFEQYHYLAPAAAPAPGVKPAPPRSTGNVSDEYAEDAFETGEDDANDGDGDDGLLFFNDGATVGPQPTQQRPAVSADTYQPSSSASKGAAANSMAAATSSTANGVEPTTARASSTRWDSPVDEVLELTPAPSTSLSSAWNKQAPTASAEKSTFGTIVPAPSKQISFTPAAAITAKGDSVDEYDFTPTVSPTRTTVPVAAAPVAVSTAKPTPAPVAVIKAKGDSDDEYDFTPSASPTRTTAPVAAEPISQSTAKPTPAPYAVRQFSMIAKDSESSSTSTGSNASAGVGGDATTYDAKKEEVLRRIQQQQSVAEQEDGSGSDGEFSYGSSSKPTYGTTAKSPIETPKAVTSAITPLPSITKQNSVTTSYASSTVSRAAPIVAVDSDDEYDFSGGAHTNSAAAPVAATTAKPTPAPYAVRQFSMVVKDPEPNSTGATSTASSVGVTTYDAKKEEVLRRIQQQQSVAEQEDGSGSDGEFSHWGSSKPAVSKAQSADVLEEPVPLSPTMKAGSVRTGGLGTSSAAAEGNKPVSDSGWKAQSSLPAIVTPVVRAAVAKEVPVNEDTGYDNDGFEEDLDELLIHEEISENRHSPGKSGKVKKEKKSKHSKRKKGKKTSKRGEAEEDEGYGVDDGSSDGSEAEGGEYADSPFDTEEYPEQAPAQQWRPTQTSTFPVIGSSSKPTPQQDHEHGAAAADQYDEFDHAFEDESNAQQTAAQWPSSPQQQMQHQPQQPYQAEQHGGGGYEGEGEWPQEGYEDADESVYSTSSSKASKKGKSKHKKGKKSKGKHKHKHKGAKYVGQEELVIDEDGDGDNSSEGSSQGDAGAQEQNLGAPEDGHAHYDAGYYAQQGYEQGDYAGYAPEEGYAAQQYIGAETAGQQGEPPAFYEGEEGYYPQEGEYAQAGYNQQQQQQGYYDAADEFLEEEDGTSYVSGTKKTKKEKKGKHKSKHGKHKSKHKKSSKHGSPGTTEEVLDDLEDQLSSGGSSEDGEFAF